MKKSVRLFVYVLTLIILPLLMVTVVTGVFAAMQQSISLSNKLVYSRTIGSGTIDDPYLVYELGAQTDPRAGSFNYYAHLNTNKFGTLNGDGEAYYFKQVEDILVSSSDYIIATSLLGHYDGDGHSFIISNGNSALFNYLGTADNSEATLKNLIIHNNSVAADSGKYGVVANYLYGTIENCEVGGAINASGGTAGGFVAMAYQNAVIIKSKNATSITGATYAGGFVGVVNKTLTIENSSNHGAIAGSYAGGLVGNVETTGLRADESLFIANSFNAGTIVASNVGGGLAAKVNNVQITSSYNNGWVRDVATTQALGGMIGEVEGSFEIDSSFNKQSVGTASASGGQVGAVSGTSGGLIGRVSIREYSKFKNVYNIGTVAADNFTGGFVGELEIGEMSDDALLIKNSISLGLLDNFDGDLGAVGGRFQGNISHVAVEDVFFRSDIAEYFFAELGDFTIGSTKALVDIQKSETYQNFDFENSSWGFGFSKIKEGDDTRLLYIPRFEKEIDTTILVTVQYDLAGLAGDAPPQSLYIQNAFVTLPGNKTSDGQLLFSKKGNSFDGWSTIENSNDALFSNTPFILRSYDSDNIVLYPVFNPITYSVELDANYDVEPRVTMSSATFGEKFEWAVPEIRVGYNFLGWETEDGELLTGSDGVSESIYENDHGGTFYAKWEAIKYTVKLDKNSPFVFDDSGLELEIAATYDEAFAFPHETFFTFVDGAQTIVRWNNMPDGSGELDFLAGASAMNLQTEQGGEITFYAIWSETAYSARIDYNNLNGVLTFNYSTPFRLMDVASELEQVEPEKFGYTFSHWSVNVDGHYFKTGVEYSNAEIFVADKFITKNITFTAHWTPDEYEITLNYMTPLLENETRTVLYEQPYTDFGKPVRSGYTFDGWFLYYISASGDYLSRLTNNEGVGLTVWNQTNHDTEVFAKWLPNSYSITLDAKGGVLEDGNTQSIVFDSVYSFEKPILEGNAFMGWFLNETFSEDVRVTNTEGGSYFNDVTHRWSIASHTTLYAKWSPIFYKVEFKYDETAEYAAFVFPGNITDPSTWVAELDLTYGVFDKYAPTPATAPFMFVDGAQLIVAWTTADGSLTVAAGALIDVNFTQEYGATISLYPVWSENTYTVEFELNSADEEWDNVVDVAPFLLDIQDPLRTGFDFNGWTVTGGGNYFNKLMGQTYTTNEIRNRHVTTNMKLVASWSAHTYTISFDVLGGSGVPSKIVTFGESYSFDVPTRGGYNFTGWFLEYVEENTIPYTGQLTGADGLSNFDGENRVWNEVGDVTVFAGWSPIEYTIVFDSGISEFPHSEWITGAMDEMHMHYDEISSLLENQYRFIDDAKQFLGWSRTIGGSVESDVEYEDQEAVVDLSTEDGSTVVLYAVWKQVIVSLYIRYNDGWTGWPHEEIALSNLNISKPTRKGYQFSHWNVEFYYDGSFDVRLSSYYFDSAVNYSATELNSEQRYITTNMTISAQWEAENYDLTLNANGGTLPDGVPNVYNIEFGTWPTLPVPTLEGYTFDSWFASHNGKAGAGRKFTDNTGKVTQWDGWDVANDIDIYAGYIPIEYEIELFQNYTGADPTSFETSILYDQLVDFSTIIASRTGYTFDGWFLDDVDQSELNRVTDADGTGSEWRFIDVTSLYAKWVANDYSVVLNLNYTGAENAEAVATFGDYFNFGTVSREAYTFLGWFSHAENQTDTTRLTDDNGDSYPQGVIWLIAEHDVQVYAGWSAISYTVEFNNNADSFSYGDDWISGTVDSIEVDYDELFSLPVSVFSFLDGAQAMVAWSTSPIAGEGVIYNLGVQVSNLASTEGEIVTLYVLWSTEKYKATFVYDNGEGNDEVEDVAPFLVTDSHIVTTPEKAGFIFLGWKITAGAVSYYFPDDEKIYSNSEIFAGFVTSNITFTAQWEGITYSVFYDINYENISEDFPAWITTGMETQLYQTGLSYGVSYAARQGTIFSFVDNAQTVLYWSVVGTGQTIDLGSDFSNLTAVNGAEVKLLAIWSENEYTVTFVSNDDTNQIITKTAVAPFFAETFSYSKKGYNEADGGWIADTDATFFEDTVGYGLSYITSNYITKSITFTMYWQPNSFEISLVLSGGSFENGEPTEIEVYYGQEQDLGVPVRTNRVFVGWQTQDGLMVTGTDGICASCDFEDAPTLYAIWAFPDYTITLEPNGGTVGESEKEVTYNDNYSLPIPSKVGYEFSGWFSDANSHTDDTRLTGADGNSVAPWDKFENATAYAGWVGKQIVVKLYNNDGTGDFETKELGFGDNFDFSEDAPTREGYDFVGWYDNINWQQGTNYPASGQWNYDVISPFSLYARWAGKQYTISLFNGYDEMPYEPEYVTVTFGQAYDFSSDEPTNPTGFSFTGWYTHEDAEQGELFATSGIWNKHSDMDDFKLYGTWEGITYIIYFNSMGGLALSNDSVTMGEEFSFSVTERENYIFLGWFNNDYTTQYTDEFGVGGVWSEAGNTTVYAKWELYIGTGEKDDPYRIYTVGNAGGDSDRGSLYYYQEQELFLTDDAELINTYYFELMNNLTINNGAHSLTFNGAGFDGDGYTITLDGEGALFNEVVVNFGKTLTVENLNIVHKNVTKYVDAGDGKYFYASFIGMLTNNGNVEISDISVIATLGTESSPITASASGFIGLVAGNVTITDVECVVSIFVSPSTITHVGGLISYVDGADLLVENIRISGNIVGRKDINGEDYYSGVISYIVNSEVTLSRVDNLANIVVSSSSDNPANNHHFVLGGLVGAVINTNLEIEYCSNLGNIENKKVSGKNNTIGGLVGYVNDNHWRSVNITDSFNWGNISFLEASGGYASNSLIIGGIVGRSNVGPLNLLNVYNSGRIMVETFAQCDAISVGGLVAYSDNCFYDEETEIVLAIKTSYNIGAVYVTINESSNKTVGGIVGKMLSDDVDNYSFTNNYYLIDNDSDLQFCGNHAVLSGIANSAKVIEDMQLQSTYLSYNFGTIGSAASGWVFVGSGLVVVGGSQVIISLPRLWWEVPHAGNFTITYNLNGASGSVPTNGNVLAQGANVALAGSAGFSRTGYYFMGWSVSPNAGVGINGNAQLYPYVEILNLYAIWVKDKTTAILNANGGLIGGESVSSRTLNLNSSYTIKPIPTRAGYYAFAGWYDHPTDGTQYTDASGASLSNWMEYAGKMLYARWDEDYGMGTELDPYLILSAGDNDENAANGTFNYYAYNGFFENDTLHYFKLLNDIDLSGGFLQTDFYGVLDGDSKTINADGGTALFLQMGRKDAAFANTIVKNLTLENDDVQSTETLVWLTEGTYIDYTLASGLTSVMVSGSISNFSFIGNLNEYAQFAGGIAAIVEVSNVSSLDSVIVSDTTVEIASSGSFTDILGGFFGRVHNFNVSPSVVIKNSKSIANIRDVGYFAGGFIGNLYSEDNAYLDASIYDSEFEGEITVGHDAGGFVGYSSANLLIEDSFNKGKIYSTNSNAGGFIGWHKGRIDDDNGYLEIGRSLNIGEVTAGGEGSAGGFVGYLDDARDSVSYVIMHSYNTGKISALGADRYAGGLIGYANNSGVQIGIINSFNVSVVEGSRIGGIAGGWVSSDSSRYNLIRVFFVNDKGVNVFSYDWGNMLVGTEDSGKTLTQLQNSATYTDVGWQFDETGSKTLPWIWLTNGVVEVDGEIMLLSLPRLYWEAEGNTQFLVEYDLNGGSGTTPIDEDVYPQGSEVTLPPVDDITREGYIFGGWSTNKTATEGQTTSMTISALSGRVTLYAVWIDFSTVVLNANGGKIGGADTAERVLYFNQDYQILPIPTHSGQYVAFDGWWSAITGGDRYTDDEGNSVNPWTDFYGKTLYARWKDDFGDGTEASPYLIVAAGENNSSAANGSFNYFAYNGFFENSEGYYFQLENNITLNADFALVDLAGYFNGGGYTVTTNGGSALFKNANNATITNLTVKNYNTQITEAVGKGGSTVNVLAGVVGVAENTTFDNVHFEGMLEGEVGYVGGLVAISIDNLTIFNSSSNAVIYTSYDFSSVGGLVGETNENLDIQNSINISGLQSSGYSCDVGGLVGAIVSFSKSSTVNISNSSNRGNINTIGNYSFAGGLIGSYQTFHINNTIENSFNLGNITAFHAGGIVGFVGGDMERINSPYISFDSCYNLGNITADSKAGGIAGNVSDIDSDILRSFNRGNVISDDGNADGSKSGGIVGRSMQSNMNISNSYNTGKLGGYYIGGLVGQHSWELVIENSYNIGMIDWDGCEYAGGILGYLNNWGFSSIESINSYFVNDKGIDLFVGYVDDDPEVIGTENSGVSFENMQIQASYNDWQMGAPGSSADWVWVPNSLVLIDGKQMVINLPRLSYEIETLGSFNITYNLNGGSGTTPTNTNSYSQGSTVMLPSGDGLTNGDYIFGGWSTSRYAVEGLKGSAVLAPYTNTLTLYAVWMAKSLVTLDANGGTLGVESVYVEYDKHYSFPVPTPIGYVKFVGWYDQLEDGNPITDESGKTIDEWSYIGDKTLYAQWVEYFGDGTEASPYLIISAGENDSSAANGSFNYYAYNGFFASNDAYYFRLENNITLNGDFSQVDLKGHFNGNNKTITTNGGSALFRLVGNTYNHASIKNLTVYNNNVQVTTYSSETYASGVASLLVNGTIDYVIFGGAIGTSGNHITADYVGGIVGYMRNDTHPVDSPEPTGYVSNSTNNANIFANSSTYVGGIVGWGASSAPALAMFTISSSKNTGIVRGDIAGGIVGYADTLAISKCSNSGTVATSVVNGIAGGIVGDYYSNSIIVTLFDLENSGAVSASVVNGIAGGIIGRIYKGIIDDVHNKSSLSSNNIAGGIVGLVIGDGVEIENSTNTHKIEAGGVGGGIVGQVGENTSFTSSFNLNSVENTGELLGNSAILGGLVGKVYSMILEIESSSNDAGVEGKTMGGLVGEIENLENLTEISIDNSYNLGKIYSIAIDSLGGGLIGRAYNGYLYNITNSYNTGEVYAGFGAGLVGSLFSDLFDSVPSFIINSSYNSGKILAHATGSDAHASGIMNVDTNELSASIINTYNKGSVTSNFALAAGIISGFAFYGNVSITNSFNWGNITASQGDAGGIITGYYNTENIDNCYNTGKIKGIVAGGIVGVVENESDNLTLYYSYNIGKVEATDFAGGIIGEVNIETMIDVYLVYFVNDKGVSEICGSRYIDDGMSGGSSLTYSQLQQSTNYNWVMDGDESNPWLWVEDALVLIDNEQKVISLPRLYHEVESTENFKITYDLNGGDGFPPSDSTWYAQGALVNLATQTFDHPENYVFLGWATSPFALKGITGSQIIRPLTTQLTLYAIWVGGVTVTLNAQGGEVTPTTSQIYIGELNDLPVPTRSGYNFEGWFSAINGGGTKYTNELGEGIEEWLSTDDVTFYAHWSAKIYIITRDYDDGVTPNDTYEVTFNQEYSLGAPTREGYTFMGWFTARNGGGIAYTDNAGDSMLIWSQTSNRTLYAYWAGTTTNITFDKQSGTGGSNSVTATYDSAMPAATAPARTGYTFGGYYDEEDGAGTQYYTSTMTSARIWNKFATTATLYAKWTATTTTITFDQQSGTGGSNSASATYDANMPVATAPSRTGYTFGGYYDEEDGAGTQYYTSTMTSVRTWNKEGATATLYAKWTAKTTTITLDLQSGTGGSTSVVATYDSAMPAATEPARTGYTFGGYYDEEEGAGTQYYTSTMTSVRTWNKESATATLYAKWTAKTTNITFDKQSGTGGSTSVVATYDSAMPAATAPARTGYTFGGYYDEEDGAGTQYYTSTMTSARIWNKDVSTATLYAKWTATTTNITFDKQSGTGGSTSVVATYDLAMPAATAPARTGYTFGGYYDEEDGAGTQYYTLTMTSARTWNKEGATATLYAKWTAKTTTITLDLQSGTGGSNSATATYDANMPSATAPARTGYTFGGYYDEEEGAGTQYFTATMTSAKTWNKEGATATLYAKWTAKTTTITFDRQSGTGGSNSVTATYDANMPSATAPARTGYTFGGYYDEEEGAGTQYFTETMTSAKTWNKEDATATLYAKWTANTFTVRYYPNTGTGSMYTQDFTYDVFKNLTANSFGKTGYNFMGWSENAGGDVVYSDSAYLGNMVVSGFYDLYAVWDAKTYSVVRNVNSGDSAMGNILVTYDAYEFLGAPSREGFAFTGWWSAASNGTRYTSDGYITWKIDAAITIYAQWTEVYGLGTALEPYYIHTASMGGSPQQGSFNYYANEYLFEGGHYFKLINSISIATPGMILRKPSFVGNFDGNGLTITSTGRSAIFSSVGGLETTTHIKNLTVRNLDIQHTERADLSNYKLAAVLAENTTGVVLIEEVTTIGAFAGEELYNLRGGGFVAYNDANLQIKNSENKVSISGGYYGSPMGGFVGSNLNTLSIENSTNSGAIYTIGSAGGFVGGSWPGANTTIKYSQNTANIRGSKVGGFVGATFEATLTLNEVTNSGEISGSAAGGLLGDVYEASITNSSNSGEVIYETVDSESVLIAAGLVGVARNLTIQNSGNTGTVNSYSASAAGVFGTGSMTISLTRVYNTGSITGGSVAGGLVGGTSTDPNPETLTIKESWNSGSVVANSSENTHAGGIVGIVKNKTDISACFNSGGITGIVAGGIIGFDNSGQGTNSISYCYNTGTIYEVLGGQGLGGLLGKRDNTHTHASFNIKHSYNIGTISRTYTTPWGGVVGFLSTTYPINFTSTYFVTGRGPSYTIGYNLDTELPSTPSGSAGATYTNMQSQSTYSGWVWSGTEENPWEWKTGEIKINGSTTTVSLPRLYWEFL